MCLSFDESYEKAKKYLELLDRPDEELIKLTEADITHFVIVPILKDALGWKPIESLRCQYKETGDGRKDYIYIDMHLKGDNVIYVEAKKIEDNDPDAYFYSEALNRSKISDDVKFCIVTNGRIWHGYNLDNIRKGEEDNSHFAKIDLFNDNDKEVEYFNRAYEYAKLYFMLNNYSKEWSNIERHYNAYKKALTRKPFTGPTRFTHRKEVGKLDGFIEMYNNELAQVNAEKEEYEFKHLFDKNIEGLDVRPGLRILYSGEYDELKGCEFIIDDNGGVILDKCDFLSLLRSNRYSAVGKKLEELKKNNIIRNNHIRPIVNALGRNYKESQWYIEDGDKKLGLDVLFRGDIE